MSLSPLPVADAPPFDKALTREVARLQMRVADIAAERDAALDRAARLQETLGAAHLETEMARVHAETCAAQYQAIANSTTWRMTWPVRHLLSRIYGLRHRG